MSYVTHVLTKFQDCHNASISLGFYVMSLANFTLKVYVYITRLTLAWCHDEFRGLQRGANNPHRLRH